MFSRQQIENLQRGLSLSELQGIYWAAYAIKSGQPSVSDLVESVIGPDETDFIGVRFPSSSRLYVYHVAHQPARRVQKGDLVTVAPRSRGGAVRVMVVSEVNMPEPDAEYREAVAISPDDRAIIEGAIGPVNEW